MSRKPSKTKKPKPGAVTDPTLRTINAMSALMARPHSMTLSMMRDGALQHGVKVSITTLGRIRTQNDKRQASPELADALEALLCAKNK